MSAGIKSRLDDICMASLHKMDGRVVVCTGICWDAEGITKIEFYEPSTDKTNQCTYSEVEAMLRKKMLVLHVPQKGRRVK